MTRLLNFNDEENFKKNAEIAGEVLRNGGLVAFPTETVYGLGANALCEKAVKSIFDAKGRPSDNPLIVHIAEKNDAEKYVKCVPETAKKIMDAFWPGPISIIMKKKDIIPDCVSAGLDTVALRMPTHIAARAIIKASKVPVAAPSANISGKPSPTNAKHVLDDMNGKIDIVADGGCCEVGIESTVIDVTQQPPVILRPGKITAEMLIPVIGEVVAPKGTQVNDVKVAKCPGMKYTHYSPNADVYVAECGKNVSKQKIENIINTYGKGKCAVLDCGLFKEDDFSDIQYINCGEKSDIYAERLFSSLRKCDELGSDTVFALICFADELADSVRNRLYKSAGNKIINIAENAKI